MRNQKYLFPPESIAVIGASNRPSSIGAALMRNLLGEDFNGPILPVNPKDQSVAGVMAYKDVASLPIPPDLALIATPPDTIPRLIDALEKQGTIAAVVLTKGVEKTAENSDPNLPQKMLEAARSYLLRVLGFNCIGLIIPGLGFNPRIAHTTTSPETLALVTQSGALVTAILDRDESRSIGFSHFISLDTCADVDFRDTWDYLAGDPGAGVILLYIESIRHARKCMSVARAAARNKPVIVVKAGRSTSAAKVALSHTGALTGAYDVCDAAIRRAGMLRVSEIEDLFDAVENLAKSPVFQ